MVKENATRFPIEVACRRVHGFMRKTRRPLGTVCLSVRCTDWIKMGTPCDIWSLECMPNGRRQASRKQRVRELKPKGGFDITRAALRKGQGMPLRVVAVQTCYAVMHHQPSRVVSVKGPTRERATMTLHVTPAVPIGRTC